MDGPVDNLRVWVDTDVALGAPAGDVDDGFALAALLGAARGGRIDLLGVSTVTGNAPADSAEDCARALAEAAGVQVPIVRGGGRSGGTGAAGQRIAALPVGARLVAIGPLSNVAAALRADPGLADRVSLRIVGGNLTSRGVIPPLWPHEFNLARDRDAAPAVLRAPWRDLALYPLDVVRRLRCDARRLDALSSRGRIGGLLARESRRWLARSRWRHGMRGFPVWDLPAALEAAGALTVAIEPRQFPRSQRAFAGLPDPVRAAVAFDPVEAWAAFDGLVSNLPRFSLPTMENREPKATAES
ncbi:MAG: nucleoside hydrolase [Thermoanaerobaculia bacterium]